LLEARQVSGEWLEGIAVYVTQRNN
jgi:hypothetical protein